MSLIKLSRRRTLLFLTLAVVAGAISISACSTEPNPPDATLAVAVSPSSINVVQGGTGGTTATITRGGSFTGPVTLTATGVPTGITVTFSPAALTTGATTSAVSVQVGAAVTTGNKTITINAAGAGVTTATATLTVAVVGPGAGGFSLTAEPIALATPVGAPAATSTITITRTAPFTGPVALTVTGMPAGVTATLNPTSAAGATSTLSVQAAGGAVNGSYPLVVRGTGSGVADATTTVTIAVTGGAGQGVSFTFTPTSVSIAAGGAAASSSVGIARSGGFTGPVDLALSGAPAGMTATVAPTNVTGTGATVTVQAGAGVAAGTYNLTLTGTGTGIPNATGTLPVTVTGAGGGGNFNLTFCAVDAPLWVAQQDGNGTWTQVLPTSGTTYPFAMPSGEGGIAFVLPAGTGTDLNVVYATAAEFGSFGGTATNFGGCGSKTVNGTVANVSVGEIAAISLGFSSAQALPGVGAFPAFVLNEVAEGAQDLVATRADATFTANKIIIRRSQNIANNGSLAVLDFNAAEAFAPGTANVTVTGIGGDDGSVVSTFTGVYGSGTNGLLSLVPSYTNASGAVPFAAVPLAQLAALELNLLTAFAPDAGNATAERVAGVYFRAPANQTVALGPTISTPTVTKLVTAPNARPRVQLASQTLYNRLFTATYQQANGRGANVFATSDYFGATPATWDVTLPDLSGAAGWNTAWGLLDGTGIDWTVSVQGGAIQFLDVNAISDGDTFQSATISSATPLTLRGMRSDSDVLSLSNRLSRTLRNLNRNPLH